MGESFETYAKGGGKILRAVVQDAAVTKVHFVQEEGVSQHGPVLDEVQAQLHAYLNGESQSFTLPLAPEGTPFQKKVWDVLLTIPFGETRTYAQLAAALGDPKVIRAAASANGKNPVAVIIPCHRVIGTDGSLTGYSGGLENKRFLLALEKANGILSLFP
jgi:methylated-DNA-[protein]-cysteine S-methyltransferase